jgi:hypothetical protein
MTAIDIMTLNSDLKELFRETTIIGYDLIELEEEERPNATAFDLGMTNWLGFIRFKRDWKRRQLRDSERKPFLIKRMQLNHSLKTMFIYMRDMALDFQEEETADDVFNLGVCWWLRDVREENANKFRRAKMEYKRKRMF